EEWSSKGATPEQNPAYRPSARFVPDLCLATGKKWLPHIRGWAIEVRYFRREPADFRLIPG
ncbi:hypothetical protein, partial [Paracoccus sp. (in: a-proteobacteria)]|uniref:hypothetical protein n=1 Tax=Paracoccus sp. TaxID=267 RepID=UPI0028AE1BD6